ncbi:hypothetical protein I7I53_02977 [Histoplasma capsulatum var. duboisii H88]|uniref:HNH nuclease domain-containing protein n=1 Tax=Ajellomyces capsulatus (strain H88) TaxID=544711 RepID=A0A8A1LLG2_AJEC8|nr:hypothetical protein I7I53_02977 [Histoplasma capsulatum var. duboisii H88]
MEPAISGGPDAEFHDPERINLIFSILKAIREVETADHVDPGSWPPLTPLVWACLWLSDIQPLVDLNARFQREPTRVFNELRNLFLGTQLGALWGARRWATSTPKSGASTPVNPIVETTPDPALRTSDRKRKRIESSSPLSGPSTPRSYRDKKCRKRDKTCVLTKSTDPTHVCHIIPFSLGNQNSFELRAFWSTLSLFWDELKITQLRDFVNQKSTETVENFLLLAPTVHACWDEQLFALQPLSMSTDKKTLTVKFFWLCPTSLDSLRLSTTALPEDPTQEFTVEPPSFPANLSQGGRKCGYAERPNLRIYNCQTNELISSGQVITLTTEDPESMPLPDLKLLDLQWKLHRVLALAAAAGYFEDEDYDDEGDYVTGNDPVIVSGDESLFDEYEGIWAKKSFETDTSTDALGMI